MSGIRNSICHKGGSSVMVIILGNGHGDTSFTFMLMTLGKLKVNRIDWAF